jgi:hypothetical protein
MSKVYDFSNERVAVAQATRVTTTARNGSTKVAIKWGEPIPVASVEDAQNWIDARREHGEVWAMEVSYGFASALVDAIETDTQS